jgi:hypothetical protein
MVTLSPPHPHPLPLQTPNAMQLRDKQCEKQGVPKIYPLLIAFSMVSSADSEENMTRDFYLGFFTKGLCVGMLFELTSVGGVVHDFVLVFKARS